MLILSSYDFEQRAEQTYELKQKFPDDREWLIGRLPPCDLLINRPDVSRVHGRIRWEGDCYVYEDMGSSNGSIVNGKLLNPSEPHEIAEADILQIGVTSLYFEKVVPLSSPLFDNPSRLQPLVSWAQDIEVVCCRIVSETPDVKTFWFVADPPCLFHYLPGQFVTIEVVIDDKSVFRPYSISSSPTRPHSFAITVQRVAASNPGAAPGVVSNWLHDQVQVGDRLRVIGGPQGHFSCLPNPAEKIMLISAGSGITPMMSMSQWVYDMLSPIDITLIHSAKTPDDLIFRHQLERMAAEMPNFRLFWTVTRPHPQCQWSGLTGRLTPQLLQWLVPDYLERHVFVCGPNGFMADIRCFLQELEFPIERQYQQDSFGGPPSPRPAAVASSPTRHPRAVESLATATASGPAVTTVAPAPPLEKPPDLTPQSSDVIVSFTQSQRHVKAVPGSSILDLAEQEGIPLRFSCRVGACGVCKLKASHGRVDYAVEPTLITAEEQDAGLILTCVAHPKESIEIDA